MNAQTKNVHVGVFDHSGVALGGGTLVAAHLASLFSSFYTVDLIRDWSGFNIEQVSSFFSLDLSGVNVRSCEDMWESFTVPGRYSLRQQLERSRAITEPYDLFIYSGHWVPPFCYAPHGLIYCHFPTQLPGHQDLLATDARWMQRNSVDRLLRGNAYLFARQACLNGYDHILANSAFTASWIERRWGVRAEVVYPPVEMEVPDAEKHNRIVSIGRFFGKEPRCKGHLAQIAAFRAFVSQVPENWELWMIGSCYSETENAYLASVQDAARDLPVRFLVNAERKDVLGALSGAKVFWHTAGLFDKKNEHPGYAEHFGMATVEAMRARCVPVVVNSGGQSEIVEHGLSGFVCEDIAEIVADTVAIANNPARLAAFAGAALCRSKHFSGAAFDLRVFEVLTRRSSQRHKRWGTHAALNMLSLPATVSHALGSHLRQTQPPPVAVPPITNPVTNFGPLGTNVAPVALPVSDDPKAHSPRLPSVTAETAEPITESVPASVLQRRTFPE